MLESIILVTITFNNLKDMEDIKVTLNFKIQIPKVVHSLEFQKIHKFQLGTDGRIR